MIYKTKGIAIRSIKYKNSGIIAHIFTERFGMQHYLVQGLNKKSSKISDNLFRGLQLLDLEVYHRGSDKLERIKEVSLAHLQHQNASDITKSTILIFLNEILSKVLKEQDEDLSLFEFIYSSILWLENKENGFQNFHLLFLVKLSKLLGFGPTASENPVYFDMRLGIFTSSLPAHPDVMDISLTPGFNALITGNYQSLEKLNIPKLTRKLLLYKLVEYYRLHNENFGEIKSLDILSHVFE